MPVKIFICYARGDERLLNNLKKQLSSLQHEGLIDLWYDRNISAGSEWEQEINQHLNSAEIILLLVSPDFIASQYCYGVEMKRALERHEQRDAVVIPIILRSVDWKNTPLSKLQALPADGKAVMKWRNRDDAYLDIAIGIKKVIEKISINSSSRMLLNQNNIFHQEQKYNQKAYMLSNTLKISKESHQQVGTKQKHPSPKRVIPVNTLFYGDNLEILREYIPDNSVDLIYLDPPFNSNQNDKLLFKDKNGKDIEIQALPFEEIWRWNHVAEQTYQELIAQGPDNMARLMVALRESIGTNQMMAYLVMMAIRLIELHRVLKSTGSLYLHCDPTSSHYLKIMLDTLFVPQNFRNEINWHKRGASSKGAKGQKGLGNTRDIVLFYSKSENFTWHPQYVPYDEAYINKYYKWIEAETGRRYRLDNLTISADVRKNHLSYEVMGVTRYWHYPQDKMQKLIEEGRIVQTAPGMVPRYKRYLDEMPGSLLQDDWDDIIPIHPHAHENMGYPAQKPLALLERLIQLGSNPGDIILDPFCGCGTTIAAAQKLKRKWIGIEITHLSIALVKYRLEEMFPDVQCVVIGEPLDKVSARQIAQEDRYQFQWWALSLVRARPLGGQEGSREGKKGKDKGIDGVIAFIDDASNKAKRVLVQVKSGHVKSGDIRDLVGIIQREQAAIGIFITLEEPPRDMVMEALKAGFYHSPGWNREYPKVQILTIEELLRGGEVKMPPQFGTFKQAQRVQQTDVIQGEPGLA